MQRVKYESSCFTLKTEFTILSCHSWATYFSLCFYSFLYYMWSQWRQSKQYDYYAVRMPFLSQTDTHAQIKLKCDSQAVQIPQKLLGYRCSFQFGLNRNFSKMSNKSDTSSTPNAPSSLWLFFSMFIFTGPWDANTDWQKQNTWILIKPFWQQSHCQ